jgi:hypothetical protein
MADDDDRGKEGRKKEESQEGRKYHHLKLTQNINFVLSTNVKIREIPYFQ